MLCASAAKNHFPVLLQKTRESNSDSRQVLEKRGCEFLKVDKETSQILRGKSADTVKLLVPNSLSKDIYDQTIGLRKKFRDTSPATGVN